MSTQQKPILVFDATVLHNGGIKSGARSGIFWTSYNLFLHFLKANQFEIWLYCRPLYYWELKRFLRSKFPNRTFTFVNQSELQMMNYLCSYLRSHKERCKREHKNIQKNLFHLASNFVRVGSYVESLLFNWSKAFSPVSYFFSPAFVFPKPIQTNSHICKAMMLYDIIPVLYPKLYPTGCPWLNEIIKSLNPTDLYFTDSESCRQDFLKAAPQIPPQHITTAYISTNLPYQPRTDETKLRRVRQKYRIPLDKKYLYSVCTMDPRKNIPFSVTAFIHFCEQHHVEDLVFVLGGSHKERILKELKKTFSQDVLARHICFTGYVDDEDMELLYSGAEMYILPSLYEGFGMPILEAMSCGCPVICSNTSSMPEVIGDCGILIDPTNEQDLINAFHKMHTDATFRQTCREKGLARAKQFSWEKCIHTITESILKEK